MLSIVTCSFMRNVASSLETVRQTEQNSFQTFQQVKLPNHFFPKIHSITFELVLLEASFAHAQTRGPRQKEGVLARALMPSASAKRPHSRITSQKRLVSCDTGNRMAFVSFRIMSSPGHITLNKTTSADENVIPVEISLSFSVNTY